MLNTYDTMYLQPDIVEYTKQVHMGNSSLSDYHHYMQGISTQRVLPYLVSPDPSNSREGSGYA